MTTNDTMGTAARAGRRWLVWAAALGVLAVGGGATAVWVSKSGGGQPVPTFDVKRGPLIISVTQSGTVQNRQQEIVKCEVEGKTTILWIIQEGTHVEKGDRLVELDSSQLEDAKAQQQIVVMNAEAAYIGARETLAVTKSQADSDVSVAELNVKFAELDLEKYLKGEYPQELRARDAEITIADEERKRSSDKLDWSQRLAKEGYITRTELQADELAYKRSSLDLTLAEGKLALLKDYTHKRTLEELQSNLEQAKMALDRVKRKASADVVQAEAGLKAKDSEFRRQQANLQKTDEQLVKCKITAPVPGMVVYATTGKGSYRGNLEPLQEGQQVFERQELIYLPTTSSMMAEVKVHESSLTKVRVGLPVRVQVDAVPGRTYFGTVGRIGLLPDAQSAWMNPDLKVYSTQIYLDGDGAGLRPGMTCMAEIIVDSYPDALYVPVQSVLRVGDTPTVFVTGPEGPKARTVRVGLDNNRVVRVLEGLKEGETVLLAPPLSQAARPAEDRATTLPAGLAERAAEAATRPAPATMPAGFDPARLRDMTPEQRRQFFENLTPEQREAMRKVMPGGGRPKGPPRSDAGRAEGEKGGDRRANP